MVFSFQGYLDWKIGWSASGKWNKELILGVNFERHILGKPTLFNLVVVLERFSINCGI